MAWYGVITDAGKTAIENHLVSGVGLNLNVVKTGTGTVERSQMTSVTDMVAYAGDGSIIGKTGSPEGAKVEISIESASTRYVMKEIGIFATLQDSSTVLIAYYNDDDIGVEIPTVEDFPDFNFTLFCLLDVINSEDLTITIDPSAYVTMGKVKNDLTTPSTDEGYVLDARQGKVLDDKIAKTYPSNTGAADQFLRKSAGGGAYWADPASVTEIKDAVEDWLDENLPQGETLVVDPTLSISQAAADAKVTGDNLSSLKSAIDSIADVNLLNGFTALTESGYYGAYGEVIGSTLWVHSEVYVAVKPSTTYSAWGASYNTSFSSLDSGWGVCFYDANKNFISRNANTHTFTTPSTCRYIRTYISSNTSYYLYSMLIEGTSSPSCYVPFGYDVITAYENKLGQNYSNSFASDLNLLDSVTIANGSREYTFSNVSISETSGRFMNAINVYKAATRWSTWSGNIEPNSIYQYYASGSTGAYAVSIFDGQGRRIAVAPDTLSSGEKSGYIKTSANAATVILNANGITPTLKKVTAITLTSPNAQGDTLLSGKKLYAAGDSITEGAGVGSFGDGIKKTYSGDTAERNAMTYASDGQGGSTMGNVTIDGYNYKSFCISRYLNIPADADYITIWFGWNDAAYGWKSMRDAYCYTTYSKYYSQLTDAEKAEVDAYRTWREWLADYVGTIDSSDDKTWYGAWNKVLTWILNNRSTARVGIVIAYGMYTELETATIAICEKYGINYVKAYDPHEFFSVGHSHGIGENQAVKRKQLYTLDNTHPNELGYEMMSTSYEKFLRGL